MERSCGESALLLVVVVVAVVVPVGVVTQPEHLQHSQTRGCWLLGVPHHAMYH